METNKLIAGIVAAAIAIIVLAGVLMPALSNATTVYVTIDNEGVPFAAVDDGNHTITVTSSATDPIIITVDGEVSALPDFSLYGSATIVYADATFVRLSSSGAVNIYGATNQSTFGNTDMGNASAGVTISITGNGCTVANADSSVTRTISNLEYYISPAGDYRLTLNPYIQSDSSIMGAGISVIDNSTCGIVWYGTMDNLTANAVFPSGRTAAVDSVNTTEIKEYQGVFKVDSVIIEWSNSVGPVGTASYTYFIAPASFTVEKAVHLTDAMNVILNVIPLLIIVSVLLGVVAVFILRRE